MRLFLMIFLVILSALAGLTAAGVAVAGHFFGSDISAWTDTSAWNSRIYLVSALYVLISGTLATLFSLFWKITGWILGSGRQDKPKGMNLRKKR